MLVMARFYAWEGGFAFLLFVNEFVWTRIVYDMVENVYRLSIVV